MCASSSTGGIPVSLKRSEVIKVTAASSIGTIFDFYDFFVAGLAAAVVWPTIFFPNLSPAASLLLSLSGYFVGYFVRPFGSLIFGYFGDKMGRLSVLIWTMITTGIGTAGIAFTPTYASIGIFGAVLINIFRMIQGIGAGGEWGGAVVLVAEYAKESKHRAFWVSWVQQGNALGTLLSSVVWSYVLVAMPRAQLFDWGWRIPFYFGLVVLVLGLIIRYWVMESPVFTEFVVKKSLSRSPSVELVKTQWKKLLILMLVPLPTVAGSAFITTFATPFSLQLGIPAAFSVNTIVWGSLVAVAGVAVFAILADKIGRRWTVFLSGIIPAAFSIPYMYMLATGNLMLTLIGNILFIVTGRVGAGAFPAMLAEQFPTRFRFSGTGLAYTISAALGAGVLPLVTMYVVQAFGGPFPSWPYVGLVLTLYFAISGIAGLVVAETKKQDMAY
jgi:MFS family permease